MRPRLRSTLPLLFAAALLAGPTGEGVWADDVSDLAAARRVFEKNLQAIRDKDRDAYLSCYLESERLARTA